MCKCPCMIHAIVSMWWYSFNLSQVVEDHVKGRAVAATRDFSRGDFVVEYEGELIDVSTALVRETAYAANPDVGSYMFFFFFNRKRFWSVLKYSLRTPSNTTNESSSANQPRVSPRTRPRQDAGPNQEPDKAQTMTPAEHDHSYCNKQC